MPGRLVVAITDGEWFDQLRARPDLTEVNFWAPGGTPFRALDAGELFLFKLHSPRNFVVGGGVFVHATTIPCSLAWEAFGEANGAMSLVEMRHRIARYRHVDPSDRGDFSIGCRVLLQPFFFDEFEWIPAPTAWKRQTQQFKTFPTDQGDGATLLAAVQKRLEQSSVHAAREGPSSGQDNLPRYGRATVIQPRLGQGAFRIVVTDAYQRRCAITGERTLPALEAAHIRPYADGGSHQPTNGLLMRRDIHALFDTGYVTITPELRFRVSRRIKEEFENGRDYYRMHGQAVAQPQSTLWRPDASALRWHNEDRFID
jgi:putative restriction endonuclease